MIIRNNAIQTKLIVIVTRGHAQDQVRQQGGRDRPDELRHVSGLGQRLNDNHTYHERGIRITLITNKSGYFPMSVLNSL